MKKNNESNKEEIEELNILNYVEIKKKKGIFKDYSDNHFLMAALRNENDYFLNKYEFQQHLVHSHGYNMNYTETFLINFGTKMWHLERIFGQKDIENFLRHQMAAGKKNYNQDQFFRSLSEVHIIYFFILMISGYTTNFSGLYEPQPNNSGANPEARFIIHDDIIIDLEVKTPGFPSLNISTEQKGAFRVNMFLSKKQYNELSEFFKSENIKFIPPRINKLVDFMNSSFTKFEKPTHKKHYNILAINWTFNDMPFTYTDEVVTLLTNAQTGLLFNEYVMKELNITKDDLSKISAIIVYRDNIESMVLMDFLTLYMNKDFKIILNKNYADQDWDTLLEILQLQGRNDYIIHTDDKVIPHNMTYNYHFKEKISPDYEKKILYKVNEVLSSDLDIIQSRFNNIMDFSKEDLLRMSSIFIKHGNLEIDRFIDDLKNT